MNEYPPLLISHYSTMLEAGSSAARYSSVILMPSVDTNSFNRLRTVTSVTPAILAISSWVCFSCSSTPAR